MLSLLRIIEPAACVPAEPAMKYALDTDETQVHAPGAEASLLAGLPLVDTNPEASTLEDLPPMDMNAEASPLEDLPPKDMNPEASTLKDLPATDINAEASTLEDLPPMDMNPEASTLEGLPPVDMNPDDLVRRMQHGVVQQRREATHLKHLIHVESHYPESTLTWHVWS